MNLAKKISRLKNLENINPDKKWEKTTKYELLEEIASQNRLMQAYKLSTTQKMDLFAMRVANRFAPSMRRVLAGFLVFMMFFGINIAAQASVPGEALWPVKRSIEEAELSLTFSTVKKTEVHIKHVNERLVEIDKILEKPADTNKPEAKTGKQKAIKTAVTHLEKDVSSVDASLKIVKEENKPLEVVELVKKVTDATKEVDSKLEEKKKAVQTVDNINQNNDLTEVLNEAKAANKKVKKSAVTVALEVHEEVTKKTERKSEAKTPAVSTVTEDNINTLALPKQNQNGSSTEATDDFETTTPEGLDNTVNIVNQEALEEDFSDHEIEVITNIVKEIVASEISQISVEVKDVKQKAEVVPKEDLDKFKENSLQDTNDSEKKVAADELEEIDTIKNEDPEETENVLNEAKVLLDSGLLKDAFEKVSAVQAKYEKAEVTLQKIEKVKAEAEAQLKQEITDSPNKINIVSPVVNNSSSTSENASTTPVSNNASTTPVVENSTEDKNTIKESAIELKEEEITL